jgi:hypothetical protein
VNPADVRRLYEEALSSDELSGLCFDTFPEVYQRSLVEKDPR